MTDDDFDDFDIEEMKEDVERLSQDETDSFEEEQKERASEANEGLDTGSYSDEKGHVIASQDLKIDKEEHSLFTYVYTDDRNDVRLGDYVLLPYPVRPDRPHSELFGVISGLRYAHRTEINDKEDTAMGSGFDERRYTLIARISPISVIQGDDDLKSRVVDMIPKPSTFMYPADNEEYLRTGLNIPDEGPFIGYMSVSGEKRPRDNPLPFKMPDDDESGEPAIFRHTLVGGSTGKGKTHFTKNILRQYASERRRYQIQLQNSENGQGTGDEVARKMLSTLIIDPENEYTEIGEDNPDLDQYDDDEPIDTLDGRSLDDLRSNGIEVGGINDSEGSTEMRTYIPDVDFTNPPQVKNSYEFSIPFSFVQEHYKLLMPFEAEAPTEDALRTSLRVFFDEYPHGTYDEFEEFMEKGNEWIKHDEPYETLTAAHKGEWVAHQNFDENIFGAVMRRVIRPEYHAVFDNGAKNLPDAAPDMFEEGRTTVVPTNHLTGEKERIVVMALLAHVVGNKLKDRNPDYNVKDNPLLLVLDEAHNYLSEPSTAQEQYIVNQYRNASRQGRKYKLGLFMVTQNPNDIDEEIRKQTNSSIYLGLEPEVIENLRIPGGFEERLVNFGKGEAIVKAPDVRAVEISGLPICVTKHSK